MLLQAMRLSAWRLPRPIGNLLGGRANVLSAPWLDRMAKFLVAEIGRVQMSDCVFEASPHAFMDTFASTSVRTDLGLALLLWGRGLSRARLALFWA